MNIPVNFDTLSKTLNFTDKGTINYSEFLSLCISRKSLLRGESLKFAFNYYDNDNNGAITADDIYITFKAKGVNILKQEIDEMFGEISSPDQRLTYS